MACMVASQPACFGVFLALRFCLFAATMRRSPQPFNGTLCSTKYQNITRVTELTSEKGNAGGEGVHAQYIYRYNFYIVYI